jgi:hypothetical protein
LQRVQEAIHLEAQRLQAEAGKIMRASTAHALGE